MRSIHDFGRSVLHAVAALGRSGTLRIPRVALQLGVALGVVLVALAWSFEPGEAAAIALVVSGLLVEGVSAPLCFGHQREALGGGVAPAWGPALGRGAVALAAVVGLRAAAVLVGALPGLAIAIVGRVGHAPRWSEAARDVGMGGAVGAYVAASLATTFVTRLAILEGLSLAKAVRRSLAIVRRSFALVSATHALFVLSMVAVAAVPRLPALLVLAVLLRWVRDLALTAVQVGVAPPIAAAAPSPRGAGPLARTGMALLVVVSAPSGAGMIAPTSDDRIARAADAPPETPFEKARRAHAADNERLADAEDAVLGLEREIRATAIPSEARAIAAELAAARVLVARERAELEAKEQEILAMAYGDPYGTFARTLLDAKGTAAYVVGLAGATPRGSVEAVRAVRELLGRAYGVAVGAPETAPTIDFAAAHEARVGERARSLETELTRIADPSKVGGEEGATRGRRVSGPLAAGELVTLAGVLAGATRPHPVLASPSLGAAWANAATVKVLDAEASNGTRGLRLLPGDTKLFRERRAPFAPVPHVLGPRVASILVASDRAVLETVRGKPNLLLEETTLGALLEEAGPGAIVLREPRSRTLDADAYLILKSE